jgi:CRISPR-associated protein Csb1
MSDTQPLTLDVLTDALRSRAAAFRCRRRLQPAAGEGTKIFPPTYAGAVYNVELRRVNNESVPCVVVDSVQSQANRMEEALQEAVDDGRIDIPVVRVKFPDAVQGDDASPDYPIGDVTSLQAPHRLADAILRDSLHDGTPFRQSEVGKLIDNASNANATPLYELGPTALVFGMWDSTGPRGGLGAKFERAVVSEIVGINCPYRYDGTDAIDTGKGHKSILPKSHGIRRDPLNASNKVQVKMVGDRDWEIVESSDKKAAKGAIRPSEINHGNVPFDGDNAGVTVDYCEQAFTLSLIQLNRLRFPGNDGQQSKERDIAARTVLAALGLAAAALSSEQGMDLRSRCLLMPEEELTFELLLGPKQSETYALDADAAVKLLADAVAAAEKAGVTWRKEAVELQPSPQLVKLVTRSQRLAAQDQEGED